MTTPAARSPLSTFWDQPAFSVGGARYLWIDVAIGAMVHGEWAAFERRLAEGLACARRAETDRLAPADEDVDQVGTAFRYARDLISGSEMSAWLEDAGISMEDWIAYLQRDVLRRKWAGEIDGVLDRFAPSPRQLESAAVAEGICSGLFDAFERSLAGRVALAFEEDHAVLADAPPSATLEEAASQLARQHSHWLAMRPEADTRCRFAALLRVEGAFRTITDRLTTPDALGEIVEANRVDFVTIALDTIAFSSESAAREAVLCVKEDRLSLHDIGALARRPVSRLQVFLEDVPAEQRDWLLSAEPGQLLGPLRVDGRFEVTRVIGRTAPTLDNDQVAERASRLAVTVAAQRAERAHVTRHARS